MPFPPSPISLPQQPHGGGGPPDLSSVVDKFVKKNPPKPPPPLSAEEMIRRDTEMRRASSPNNRFFNNLSPWPLKLGPHSRYGVPDPMSGLEWETKKAKNRFPEVFGGAVPDFLQGNAIDDQKMLWEAQMSDSPRDINRRRSDPRNR